MISVEDLKEKLRVRLIEHDGNIEPNDLLDLIEDARELGIDKEQIARLVPEVDRSINWEHIRTEKIKAAALLQQEQEKVAARRAEIEAAPEYLEAIISFCMADGIVEAEELHTIFQKAEALEQSKLVLASKIRSLLEKGKFRPYPNANLSADGLHEVLMSTSWYTEKAFPRQEQPPYTPAHIIDFSVDKAEIRNGGHAILKWNVTGADYIFISHLGKTTKLQGEQIVQPEETIKYTLSAGNQQREINIVVTKPARGSLVIKIAIWGLIIFAIVRFLMWSAAQSSHTGTSGTTIDSTTMTVSPGLLTTGKTTASSNVTADEKTAIVVTMNRYLKAQGEDNTSTSAINYICDFYSYPILRYYKEKYATRQFVYNNVLHYRSKYRQDKWALNASKTGISKLRDGSYEIDLEGMFSYYIRNPKVSNGYKEKYLHNRYCLNREYKIFSVYEFK